jgi:hypothetical protein
LLFNSVSLVLKTGKDATYRRICCQKVLDIEEVFILCQYFRISFDKLMDRSKSNHPYFDSIYRPVSNPKEYLFYLLEVLRVVESQRNSQNPQIFISATDIPLFHLITQKHLVFFRLYTWAQSVYNYNKPFEEFLKEIETPDLIDCFKHIIDNYNLIPSSEIWENNTIDTTLKLIEYYFDIGSFSNKEIPMLLCQQVENIINKLQGWTEKSIKKDSVTPFHLYNSEMDLGNTYILLKESKSSICIVKLFTTNSLIVIEKEFCDEVENWLVKLAQRSVLLCGNAEKDRIKFFNIQKGKIESLVKKIIC